MGLPPQFAVDRRITDRSVVEQAIDATSVTSLADEQLVRLHRVLYPAFLVRYRYRVGEDDAFQIREDAVRTDAVLIDGLWSGNDAELAPYTEGACDPERVDRSAFDLATDQPGPGDTIVLEFQATDDRAAGLLPDRVDHYVADNGYSDAYAQDLHRTFDFDDAFDIDSFEGIESVDRVYLPFWLAEFHEEDDQSATLRSFRGLEDLRRDDWRHQWVASFFGEDPARVAEYGHAVDLSEGKEDNEGGDSPQEQQPVEEPSVVQPDDVELDAERLVDPAPHRGFADVGGMDALKRTLERKVIDPLERPETYAEYGIGSVTGVLLHGPPGCGKTYLAGALAGELGYSFVELRPADLTSRYMGQPAQNVADAFAVARENAPCLVFLDEIDAVAGSRDGQMNTSEQQMVNQLLTELERAGETDVIVVGATNLIEDVDPAIRRSGRFDERIEVPPPDADARREILSLYLDERPTDEGIDLDPVVSETAGYAASDVEQVADEAARLALQDSADIGQRHLVEAAESTRTSIPDYAGEVEDTVDVTEPSGVDLNAHHLLEPNPNRTFADVGGMAALKDRLRETVIRPHTNADAYDEYGLGVTDGVLLYGPPGCGKTYIAGALAGELGHAFLPVTPAEITSKWMGRPAKNVADLFDIAAANAPCVLFVDEIDGIAGSRAGGMNTSEQQMVNQLLTELESVGEDVVVVAATNLIEDVDPAIRRSGRFDERIEVPPPDADARRAILRIHLQDRPTGEIDWEPIVAATAGYAASDLELLADVAARQALGDDAAVGTGHLEAAVEATASSLAGWTDGPDYDDSDHTSGLRYIG